MLTIRSSILAAVVTLASFVAVPVTALAAPGRGDAPAKVQHGDKGERDKKFPMPAAEFKAKVDARTTKARAHVEKRAATLPADQAKELRAKFEAGVAKVGAEVAKATADGTVTADEAKAVRKVAREARPGHGKHARHGKKHGDKK
jgi:hypothetical protein